MVCVLLSILRVTFALIKSFVFAFLISSISSFKGYFTRGGALEVGITTTAAVTASIIAVLLSDYLLAPIALRSVIKINNISKPFQASKYWKEYPELSKREDESDYRIQWNRQERPAQVHGRTDYT